MLSLAELRRAAGVLTERCAGARVERIVQPDEYTLVLTVYGWAAGGAGRKIHLLWSCRPGVARLGEADNAPAGIPVQPAFAQYARAHLAGARLAEARILGGDRQLALRLRARGGEFDLLLSILGPRSNIYLLEGQGKVAAAMRPFESTRRDLTRGAPWTNPITPPPPEGEDRWAEVGDGAFLQAIEEAYRRREAEEASQALQRRLARAIEREREALDRKRAAMEEELQAAGRADEWRQRGELLKTVLHAVAPGAKEAVASDPATGDEVVLPLDPARSAAENLAEYFRKYQRAARTRAAVRERLETVRRAREALDDLGARFEAVAGAGNTEALDSLAADPETRKLLARHGHGPSRGEPRQKSGARRRDVPARLLPRRYRSAAGLEIWVGRSDEGNDYLTTRLARGNDLFFHLESGGGSHVVLRCEGRKDPPPEAVVEACEIAAHFSKARGDTRVDILVAGIKDVKKPRGAKPGLVHVMRGKTIHLRRSRERLQRLLAARVEES